MAGDVGLKLGVEGEKAFKQSIRDINNSFKLLSSEMNLATSYFGKNERSVESLTSTNKELEKQIDAQRGKLHKIENALESASNSFGEADERTLAWKKQLNNAKAELNKMERSVEDNTNEIDKLRKATEKSSNVLDKFNDKKFRDKLGKIGDKAKNCAKIAVAAFATMVTGAVSKGIQFNAQMEQYETSFEVMTGSAEKASAVVEELKNRASATPFELPQLAETTELLMNYGFTADGAMDRMEMLGDISQGSSEKMSRIATAYGQMSSAGKVSLEDVKQMIEAGFNPLNEISQSTGESMANLYDRISKGTISVDEITESMKRSTSQGGKYFQSMEKQSKTLNGQMSTLKDTISNKLGEATKKLNALLVEKILPKLIKMIDNIDIDRIIDDIVKTIEVVKKLSPLIMGVGTAFVAMKAVSPFLTITKTIVDTTEAIKTATTGAKLFNAMLSSNAIGLVVGAVAGLTAGVIALDDHMQHNSDTAKTLGDSLKDFAEDTTKAYEEYGSFKESMATEGADVLLEVDSLQKVKDKLFELVDGKTKLTEIEKNQAEFYLTELNPHLDEQLRLQDLLKGSNDEISKSIDRVIEKKKAEMLLDAYKDDYTQALKEEKIAQEELNKILLAEAELKKKIQNTSSKHLKLKYQDELRALHDIKDETVATLEGYSITLNDYDNAMGAMAEGRSEDVAKILGASNEIERIVLETQNATNEEAQAKYQEHYDKLLKQKAYFEEQQREGNAAFRQENLDNTYAEIDELVRLSNEKGIAITKSYASAIGDGRSRISKATNESGQIVIDAFGKPIKVSAEKGRAFMEKYTEGVDGKKRDLYDSLGNLTDEAIKDLMAMAKEAPNIGEETLAGIQDGIDNGESSVLTRMGNFATDLLSKAKNVLGIHSPSRVFRDQIGKNIALGVGGGFSDNMKHVNKRMSDELGLLTSNMNKSLSSNFGFNSHINSTLSFDTSKLNSSLSSLTVEASTQRLEAIVLSGFNRLIAAGKQVIVLDTGVVASAVDSKLGHIALQKARGY